MGGELIFKQNIIKNNTALDKFKYGIRIDVRDVMEYRDDSIYVSDEEVERKKRHIVLNIESYNIGDYIERDISYEEIIGNCYLIVYVGDGTIWVEGEDEWSQYMDYGDWIVKRMLE